MSVDKLDLTSEIEERFGGDIDARAPSPNRSPESGTSAAAIAGHYYTELAVGTHAVVTTHEVTTVVDATPHGTGVALAALAREGATGINARRFESPGENTTWLIERVED